MKKLNLVLLLGLIGLSSCKQETLPEIDNSKPVNGYEIKNAHPLNGEQTANLIATFYQILEPRLGSHLVEPNAVLTLAGLRGLGNFLTHNLSQDEKNNIEKLNKKTHKLGIKFSVHEDTKDKSADILIINFGGYEYASKLSSLPFVYPYKASSGFDGLKLWIKQLRSHAQNYFKDVRVDSIVGNPISHLITGLELGYPDQALLDAFNTMNRGLAHDQLEYSTIAYSDHYTNPEPNFGYLPEHKNSKSIVKTVNSWGNLLEEF